MQCECEVCYCVHVWLILFFFPPPIKGVVVKTDYVPLLQSLAPYGWRLMCVLPTPIVKTNRYTFIAPPAAAGALHLC